MLNDENSFFHNGEDLELFGRRPRPQHARNPVEEPEGIDKPNTTDGQEGDRPQNPDLQGKPPGVVSLTTIEVLDAICEGPIEGLASGEYEYVGINKSIGYESAKFVPFFPIVDGSFGTSNAHVSGYLRSIFYNGVEILDKNGRKNFQNVSTSFTNGTVGGVPLVLDSNSNKTLEVVKSLSERLRGPEVRYKTAASDPTDMELVPGTDSLGRDNSKFYKISNRNCTSFRINVKVSSLSQTLVDPNLQSSYENQPAKVGRGDTKGVKVIYRIDYRPYYSKDSKNEPFSTKTGPNTYSYKSWNPISEEIYGKVSGGYIRQTTVIIDKTKFAAALVDPDFIGWEVMIYRETPDSFAGTLRNQTFIDSIVEGFEESYAYPNTAFVRSRFRADNFSQVPSRQFRTRLTKIKVPNNYNPILRTYGAVRGGSSIALGGEAGIDGTSESWNGDWKRNTDGTIKRQWTNNPAWVFFDLLTNKRYGLGNVLDEETVDKWSLFEIAKYCDQLVPDGKGGFEPRFTADIYINTQADAYQVLNDFSSIFRGISLYAGGQIKAISDKPQSSIYAFTNANVLNGDFVYSSSAKKARHTVCLVRFNDKDDSFKPSVVYSEDAEGIQKYGFRIKELSAFGCTSKGQALRLAKWTMATERLETQTVSFRAGVEVSYLGAGDLIQISDIARGNYQNIDARRRAGRTKRISFSGDYTTVELDSSLSGYLNNGGIGSSDNISFNILTPPAYADVVTTDLSSSAESIYLKKSAIQKLIFRKADCIESGRSDVDAGHPNHFVSIVTFDHTRLAGSGNQLNTSSFNVTGFTGILRNFLGTAITGTGFAESAPDDFIWSVEVTGKNLNITPEIDLYKIVSMQEKEGLKFSINAIEYKPEKYSLIDEDLVFEVPTVADFPGLPTNFLASNFEIENTKLVKTRIGFNHPSVKTYLAGCKLFVKYGSPFDNVNDYTEDPEGKFPNTQYYFTFVSKTVNSTEYLPYSNGTYYVRIYSVNNQGKTSNGGQYLEGTFAVQDINLLLEMEVKSLRLTTDTDTNNYGTKDANGEFSASDISVQWQAGFFTDSIKDFVLPSSLTYRVTYREPDQYSNTPSSIILFERTGLSPRTFNDTLLMSENLGISLPPSYAGQVTPIRSFDIVVEAVDGDGYSSAGGQIIRNISNVVTKDSTYTNPEGYDIIFARDSEPDVLHITDTNAVSPETCLSDIPVAQGFCSEQWINEDGAFNFVIKKDAANLVESGDIESMAFLISKAPFTASDIQSKLNALISDTNVSFVSNQNVFNNGVDALIFSDSLSAATTIPTPFKGFSQGSTQESDESGEGLTEVYASVALVDVFMSTAIGSAPYKKDLVKKLGFSNVVKVLPKNAFLKDSLLYRAWAIVHVNWESADQLMFHCANIEQIELTNYTAPYVQQLVSYGRRCRRNVSYQTHQVPRKGRKFFFSSPLPSRGYEVVITYTPEPVQYGSNLKSPVFTRDLPSHNLQVISKTKEYFEVIDMSPGGWGQPSPLKGSFFFGVMLGTLIFKPLLTDPFGAKISYPIQQ